MPDEEYYALALDHRKLQVPSVTSNPGHLLWSNAITPERAKYVARRLLADDLFSGWGVRTLSSLSPSFNPMGYHNGTVWPHDNALVAAGLRRYGHDDLANQVIEAIFLAGLHFRYYRLPELFCGFTKDVRYRATPAEYPVSCSPQSWAAGSALLFLKTMLGLQARGLGKAPRRPAAPAGLDSGGYDPQPQGRRLPRRLPGHTGGSRGPRPQGRAVRRLGVASSHIPKSLVQNQGTHQALVPGPTSLVKRLGWLLRAGAKPLPEAANLTS